MPESRIERRFLAVKIVVEPSAVEYHTFARETGECFFRWLPAIPFVLLYGGAATLIVCALFWSVRTRQWGYIAPLLGALLFVVVFGLLLLRLGATVWFNTVTRIERHEHGVRVWKRVGPLRARRRIYPDASFVVKRRTFRDIDATCVGWRTGQRGIKGRRRWFWLPIQGNVRTPARVIRLLERSGFEVTQRPSRV
jgi:hypothetical protein